MAGIIPHLTIAILSMIIVHAMHFKWEFSWAIFVGNFLPDIIKFGPTALKQGVFSIASIVQDPFYYSLADFSGDPTTWFSMGFFVLGTTMTLFHHHHISLKSMTEYDELYVFLLVGILIHLAMDLFFIEAGIWF